MVRLVSSGDGAGKTRQSRKVPRTAQLRIPLTDTVEQSAVHLLLLTNLCQEWERAIRRARTSGDDRREVAEIKHCIAKANRLLNLPVDDTIPQRKQWPRPAKTRHE